MSWWGKALGGVTGLIWGGPVGAVIGATLGHVVDRSSVRVSSRVRPGKEGRALRGAFFEATFAVMGYLAKADGRVSEKEIRLAEAVIRQMGLGATERRAAIELFRRGKRGELELDELLARLRRECHQRQDLIQVFLEIQLRAALADGSVSPAERDALRGIAERLGVAPAEIDRLIAQLSEGSSKRQRGAPAGEQAASLESAYRVLGVSRSAGPQQIKTAYRRLMSRHHPDKLAGRDSTDETLRAASQRTHEIREAYERIREARGF